METHLLIGQSPLGKPATYSGEYRPDLLFPVPRAPFRETLGITGPALPFTGYDLWTSYEFSWLNAKGKPVSAIAQFLFPCTSAWLIESKSFKLYLNSFHQTRYDSMEAVQNTLEQDLSRCVQAPVTLSIAPMTAIDSCELRRLEGTCLDDLDISVTQYTVDPDLLAVEADSLTETLYSDLLKSNCPRTGQPDWASVQIAYTGRRINQAQLLKYLISYRQHAEFHEHCVERIFMDILQRCQPQKLTIKGYVMRRGGLDIQPCRSTDPQTRVDTTRLIRQ